MGTERVKFVLVAVASIAVSTLGTGLSLGQATGAPPFQVVSTISPSTIAGRPVQLDAEGKLLPWPMPNNTGYSYSSHVLAQWTILWDQYNRQRLPWYYCCFDFDRTSFELHPDPKWVNSTGYLRGMMEGFIERLYPYTGDRRTLTFLESLVDYELENGLTPENYAWAGVPYASADPGAKKYTGWSQMGKDYLEPHVVGEDGYGYLRLYEIIGNTKYLRAAIRCADALVKNYTPGDATSSPWPVRLHARDGSLDPKNFGTYSANVIEPIMLFDELIRLKQGDVPAYEKVRAGAWKWFLKYPVANDTWVGYFEDTAARMENMNQVIPLEFARYVLLHPEKDPQWQQHAFHAIQWVKSTPKWPKFIVHGALITTEQGDGKQYCCNDPNQCCDSHTSRLAAVEALYYAATGDVSFREAARRSYNWVTYFQGLPGSAHPPFTGQFWFTDEFSDGPRRLMDGFWAVPEWAPADESHLLGSSSVVTNIAYGKGSVTYSTFDADSSDVLRIDFTPRFITADGNPLAPQSNPSLSGYTFDPATGVLRIRHEHARNIDIHGEGGSIPPLYVTFDDPHVAAGTILNGQYPSGVIDWGAGQWKIHTPEGGFGTFNLAFVNPASGSAEFRFYAPRIFLGVDVTNTAASDARITIRSPETGTASFAVKPGVTERLRTGWHDASSSIIFEFRNGEGLRLDNLAYAYE